MKSIKKLLMGVLLFICLTMMVSVDIPELGVVSTVEAATVKINKKKASIEIGKTLQLKISGTKKKVKWSTSNKKIATVSSKGKVKAKKAGKAKITAKIGKKKYTCVVTVKKKASKNSTSKTTPVPVSKYIQIPNDTIELDVGQSKEISIKSNCSHLTEFHSNSDVIDIKWGTGYNIIISAKKIGESTIKVYDTNNSNLYKTIRVIVKIPATAKITNELPNVFHYYVTTTLFSSTYINGYEVSFEPYFNTGNITLTLKLSAEKIYDIYGDSGSTMSTLTCKLYNSKDILVSTWDLAMTSVSNGDKFILKHDFSNLPIDDYHIVLCDRK